MGRHLYKLFLNGEISNLPEHNFYPPNLTMLTLWSSQLKQDSTPILERLHNLAILHLGFNFYNGEQMIFSSNGFPLTQRSVVLQSVRKRVEGG